MPMAAAKHLGLWGQISGSFCFGQFPESVGVGNGWAFSYSFASLRQQEQVLWICCSFVSRKPLAEKKTACSPTGNNNIFMWIFVCIRFFQEQPSGICFSWRSKESTVDWNLDLHLHSKLSASNWCICEGKNNKPTEHLMVLNHRINGNLWIPLRVCIKFTE